MKRVVPSQFKFFAAEVGEIRTPDFFVFERGKWKRSTLANLPPSYLDFICYWGNARLFRKLSYYKLGVLAPPQDAAGKQGEKLLKIGHYDDANAYFKADDLRETREVPVYEWSGSLRKVSDCFYAWFESRFKTAKKSYSRKEWKALQSEPAGFTERERQIVAARKKFKWSVLKIGVDNNVTFRIRNQSTLTLPYFSLGVRSKISKTTGGVWLSVADIAPGTSGTVVKECYKNFFRADEMEFFDQPNPEPHNKDRYWEFRD